MSAISMRIDADTLAQRTGGSWAGPAVANHVTSIEIDSRRCGEGSPVSYTHLTLPTIE